MFKNYDQQFVIKSKSIFEGQKIFNFYLVYVSYSQEEKLVKFSKPLLIAKETYIEEKKKNYHYNIAYRKIMGWYDLYSFASDKNISERTEAYEVMNNHYDYYSEDEFNLKYVDYNDYNIKGYPIDLIIKNAYLIEILQKYNSSYLFNQLYVNERIGKSNKLLDLFKMRDSGLSNKQLVSIIKYFSKHKNLDISIYKDYLNDLKMLGYKINNYNLKNKNYKERHQEFSKRITQANNKKKNEMFVNAYNYINDIHVDNVFIITPKSMEDLVKEGDALKHCVGNGTYANRVVKGESKIFFIRKNPEEPLLTAEISGEEIKQIRGYDNLYENVDDQFLKKSKDILKNYLSGQYNDLIRKEQVNA
jgi:hypothetical protein